MASTQEQLTDMLAPVVEVLECELWGLEYLIQGRQATLRIYIDKDAGVSLADCEKVSRQVSSVLDVEDPIASQYTLEVSSPGVDRPLFTLGHYQRSVGEMVVVKLNRKFAERKKLKGVIGGIENDEVVIQVGDEEYLLPIESIEKANIVPNF
ncbi:ribosome maturation factor RimP [Candidatus Endobugula sertula]|uniref:Ribosome maturation factor RimP n=1 Tax=Candidatus Endobugula sertula TaxID=62101 RepID=A0A1D2QMM2_9GAMM|nr:ribosome maturation factor RimP [Candidatus Endobugula sertula]